MDLTQPSSSSEPLLASGITPSGRLIAVGAAAVIVVVAFVAHSALLGILGAAAVVGALSARGVTTTVEAGNLIRRHDAAPLRGGGTETIPAARIQGIEVVHEHDSESAPGRADQYWAAVRLTDRRRPISLGQRHYDRGSAEADASRLREALGRTRPSGDGAR